MGETLVTELMGDAGRHEARRLAAREFRPRRTPAALCAALLVTAAGGLAAAEASAWQAGRPLHPAQLARAGAELRRLSWADALVLGVAAGLAVVGLAFFLLAVLPGRTRMEPLYVADPLVAAAVPRRALRRTLATAVLEVPGIEEVKVRLRGRLRPRVIVHAGTHYRNPGNLAALIRAAVTARLNLVDPLRRPRTVIRLRWRQD